MNARQLVAVDIGNTQITIGFFVGGKLVADFRLHTERERTADEYAVFFSDLVKRRQVGDFKPAQVVMCSVVPPLTEEFGALLENFYKQSVLVVDHRLPSGIVIKIPEPASLGADRIANSIAARDLFGAPAVVIDFGTATTFDVVGPDGAYEGGIIIPGPMTALESLVREAWKLPKVQLAWPDHVLGTSTISAMQSGTVIGYACMIEGLLKRLVGERGIIGPVIATGGLGSLFSQKVSAIQHYQPSLTLEGLRIIAEKNTR